MCVRVCERPKNAACEISRVSSMPAHIVWTRKNEPSAQPPSRTSLAGLWRSTSISTKNFAYTTHIHCVYPSVDCLARVLFSIYESARIKTITRARAAQIKGFPVLRARMFARMQEEDDGLLCTEDMADCVYVMFPCVNIHFE